MMKKHAVLALCMPLLVLFTACNGSKNIDKIIAENSAASQTEQQLNFSSSESGASELQTEVTQNTDSSQSSASSGEVEVDLTTMSSTMVYAEVYNMMMYPDEYMGKIVKLRGTFAVYHDDNTGKDYFAAVVSDATACCSQGIEFVWDNGTHKYPDEYPPADTEIEIQGPFGVYEELGKKYAFLTIDDLKVVDDTQAQ